MKKIMIALIAGAMGVAAQAASVLWSASAIWGYNDPGLHDAPHFYDNYCAYLIDTKVFGATITAANYKEAIDKATTAFTADISRVGSSHYGRILAHPVDIPDGAEVGLFVTLILDNTLGQETSFVVSDPMSVSDNKLAFKFSDITKNKEWTPAGVPEPSSAMLLLLGFAGLALKRRRIYRSSKID